jgi:S-adenosylmethionine:tRNA ribosyltransferase-isomerase
MTTDDRGPNNQLMHPKDISILDYTYSLPDEKIAAFPLQQRDASKLLIYKNGKIQQDIYKNIADHLPEKSLLVFNNTKVIPARILFQKVTGSIIEIFCLEPSNEYNVAMQQKGSSKWKCLIGGVSKWKEEKLKKQLGIKNEELEISAVLVEKLSDAYIVEFSWQPAELNFAEIIQYAGETPLPPYIKRKADDADKERYQTIYATYDGSVAAPTAGLHFTEAVFSSFIKKEITKAYVTLHVGAGTFKPVKALRMEGHEMHTEWIEVNIGTVEQLINNLSNTIVATGTTSLRTIESLYWMGVKTMLDPAIENDALAIHQWEVYDTALGETNYSPEEALSSLLKWMKQKGEEKLISKTQILITPGYKFKIAKALITNFHQPQSTLLLLVAAAIGNNWKEVYNYALENEFRFLSYGDGSLLFIAQ